MFAAGGAPGEVHAYFSPFQSPMDAFVAAQSLLFDFENRIRLAILTANEPFLFCEKAGKENFTGVMSWSLKGFVKALQTVEAKVVEFHNRRGDFERWVEHSLQDETLAHQLKEIRASKLKAEALRKAVLEAAENRLKKLSAQVQEAVKLF
jgi:alpha-amylase